MDDLLTITLSMVAVVGTIIVVRAILTKPKRKQDRWFEVGSSDIIRAHKQSKKDKKR